MWDTRFQFIRTGFASLELLLISKIRKRTWISEITLQQSILEQIRGPASSRDRKIAFIKRDSYIFIDIYNSSTKNVLLLVLYLVDLCLFFYVRLEMLLSVEHTQKYWNYFSRINLKIVEKVLLLYEPLYHSIL